MTSIPSDYRYSKTHEWVVLTNDGNVILGITNHAQESLGDIVFVDLPEKDLSINSGDEICVIESSKAASDIYSPIKGTIIAINDKLTDNPELINQDPYKEGWIIKIKPDNLDAINNMLTASEYQDLIK